MNNDADELFAQGCEFDMERHDFEQARHYYELAAKLGHSGAWNNLACMILNGEGFSPDLKLAAQYYLNAAKCGDESGIYNYARTLEDCANTAEDWQKIIQLYRKSNHPSGWYNLALLYDFGNEFIAVNHAQANRYYQKASDAGHADATTNLAGNLHGGVGIRKDWKRALQYAQLAAERGDEMAFCHLGQAYLFGDGTRRNYRKAFEYFKKSFLGGYAGAARWIGDCYRYGQGVKRDLRKAALWLKRAAKQGDKRSLFNLGYLYVSESKSWKDDLEGRSYLQEYLEHHPEDGDALYWIAKSYGKCYADAMPIFEKLYARDRDPWSAYAMIKLKLKHRRCFAPDEFSEMTQMLRHAARHAVPDAKKLLRSKRWQHLAAGVMTSEALAERYRRSLRWSGGNHRPVLEFQGREGRSEFEIAKRYLSSSHWLDVITGANLIDQLGYLRGKFPFAEESSALLIAKMPEVKTDDERQAILRAIAWQRTEAGAKFVLSFVDSPDDELRHIVAWGIYGENRKELETLLKLAHDPQEDVWDWAIYNLINEGGELYPELQNDLTELAKHPNPLMRYQAIAALAARHADNAEALLRKELEAPISFTESDYLKDAATYLHLPELGEAIEIAAIDNMMQS